MLPGDELGDLLVGWVRECIEKAYRPRSAYPMHPSWCIGRCIGIGKVGERALEGESVLRRHLVRVQLPQCSLGLGRCIKGCIELGRVG